MKQERYPDLVEGDEGAHDWCPQAGKQKDPT
jgi:hypothetical protein